MSSATLSDDELNLILSYLVDVEGSQSPNKNLVAWKRRPEAIQAQRKINEAYMKFNNPELLEPGDHWHKYTYIRLKEEGKPPPIYYWILMIEDDVYRACTHSDYETRGEGTDRLKVSQLLELIHDKCKSEYDTTDEQWAAMVRVWVVDASWNRRERHVRDVNRREWGKLFWEWVAWARQRADGVRWPRQVGGELNAPAIKL